MKKLSAVSFEEVAKPIWRTVKAMGLSGEELDELIEEQRPKLVNPLSASLEAARPAGTAYYYCWTA
jgi:hypothetical protein